MRLYVQDRRTEKMAHFLRLTDKRREHTHSLLRSQAVRLAVAVLNLEINWYRAWGRPLDGNQWNRKPHLQTISLSLPYATAYARIPLPRARQTCL